MSIYSSMPGDNPLFAWLEVAVAKVREVWDVDPLMRLAEVQGPFGMHGVSYGEDDEGEYATIGFTLPDDIYAEIEGETYAQLQGFRFYRVDVSARLEYLRGEIEAERISYSEIAELQNLVPYIDPSDVLLLQWAGVPEFPEEDNANG